MSVHGCRRRVALRSLLVSPLSLFLFLLFLFLCLPSPARATNFASDDTNHLEYGDAFSPAPSPHGNTTERQKISLACNGIPKHKGFPSSCSYLEATENCDPEGYIDYLKLYYCTLQNSQVVRTLFIIIWPLALFFMLGNTAADFFCPALEEISKILSIPPTVAGVTLLPFGNGSVDVFASIAAFTGAGAGDVGLNSVLGAALFLTTVVAGSICLAVGGMAEPIAVDMFSFYRDVSFYLFSLLVLLVLILIGKISLFYAVCFMLIYVLYGTAVALTEVWRIRTPNQVAWLLQSLQLGKKEHHPLLNIHFSQDELVSSNELHESLLHSDEVHSYLSSFPEPDPLHFELPQWKWTSNVAIFSRSASLRSKEFLETHKEEGHEEEMPLWGWMEDEVEAEEGRSKVNQIRSGFQLFVDVFLKFPLTFPRRITIPVCRKELWSYPYAVASMFSAPLLLAYILSERSTHWEIYAMAGSVGSALSLATFFFTKPDLPPKGRFFTLLWVFAEFGMSIIWFYLIANELVAFLLFMGIVFRLNSAFLGLTVLAWGNSIGDSVANLALAWNGSRDSVQMAWSGCFAGPLFNTLLGLGSPFVIMAWRSFPEPFSIPHDPSLPWTIVFAALSLLTSLILLSWRTRKMQLNRWLGISLLCLYALFMALRATNLLGGNDVSV